MATKGNTKLEAKVKKLIGQWEDADTPRNASRIETSYQYGQNVIDPHQRKLKEIQSTDIKGMSLKGIKECEKSELEFNALDSEEACKLPERINASIRHRNATLIDQYGNLRRHVNSLTVLLDKLNKMKAPINKSQEATFERQMSTARQELEEPKSNETIDSYHKWDLILKIETEFERLDKEVTDQFLNVEVWDSIDLIEKTLAEPHLYSLPHLIMWRNTAQEKIQKIKNFPLPIPQEIVTEKIEKYESLIKQLRAEILGAHIA